MKAQDIINQLKAVLPRYTDYFSNTLDVASITPVGLLATVTTNVSHNLQNGDTVQISDTLVPREITNLTSADGIAYAETGTNHDQTENYPPGDVNVEIIGANEADYNGKHALLSVPNRQNFTYEIDSGAPVTATGTIYILENLRAAAYNGYHTITVVDTTTFTFPLERELGSPAQGNYKVKSAFRISGEISLDECVRAYTKQAPGKLWAFVVLEDILANKDRSEDTDATFMAPAGNTEYRQLAIQQFHIYIFLPTTTTISARLARDLCDDLLVAFNKSLLRLKLPAPVFEKILSGVVFVKSGIAAYDTAFYVHDLLYECTLSITYSDTIDEDTSVAFRDIPLNYRLSITDDGTIKREGWVNLDDEPLI